MSTTEKRISHSDLCLKVNNYVSEALLSYKPTHITSHKVIHDAILGTNYFSPYEIAILDLPIVQRLRRISQIDVAPLVFPSGNHNRFEHTIGVTAMAGKIVDALFLKRSNQTIAGNDKDYVYRHCRVAALLHDCGHGPFSHLSEQVYDRFFSDIKQENIVFSGASSHEILSYCIATCPAMKEYFRENILKQYNIDIDLDFVGEIIVGYVSDPNKAFIVEIINGAFDADKLDYILRDSHATGLQMTLDISRLLYTLDTQKDNLGKERLSLDISGAVALEQIVFNKMYLNNSIYHHQKVLAAGCLVKDILFQCEADGVLKDPVDYLKYTDDAIYAMEPKVNGDIKKNLSMLRKRHLPKRALVISRRTIDQNVDCIDEIMRKEKDKEFLNKLRNEIVDEYNRTFPSPITYDQVWVDVPKVPKFKEGDTCVVKATGEPDDHLMLRDIFPITDWVSAFSQNKWKAYVFADQEIVSNVAVAAKVVFEYLFNIKLNKFSRLLCKIVADDECELA